MTPHVTASDIAAFRARTLDRERTEAIGMHVRECADCSRMVFADPGIRRSMSEIFAPATQRPARLAWVAAIAAVVAGVIVMLPVREQAPPVAPPPVHREPAGTSIRDGLLVLTMDAKGSLQNIASPLQEWNAMAEAALRNATVPRADLHTLTTPGETLRGPEEGAPRVTLLSPVAVAVESATPTLSWTAARGARYRALIAEDGGAIATSGLQSGTAWTPRKPLRRGVTYGWQLIVVTEKREWTLPAPDMPPTRFRIISDAEMRELEAARATRSHLLTGLVAARLGIADLAERELAQFASEHREIAAASRLADAAARSHTR